MTPQPRPQSLTRTVPRRCMSRRSTAAALGLGGTLLLVACRSNSPSASDPAAVLREYAGALERGRYDEAYELMSLEYRKRYTRAEFERALKERPDELKQMLAQLRERPRQVDVSAQVGYGEGDALKLSVERGAWRIDSDPLEFYGQRTPGEALRSFVRAIERRRYDVVLRFVPAKWAEAMTAEKLRAQWEGDKKAELERLLKNLKANLGAPIEEDGDNATMPYGENFKVAFVREDGVWKIADPD